MKHSKQMSESVRLGILLALSGGLMDAYSYIVRDRVFANAQTGNMLLFGVNLSEGNIRLAIHYLVPVVAFAIGIALAEYVHTRNIGVATTMCIGNMRTGTQNLFNYFHSKDRDSLGKAGLYYGIIVSFILGAVFGNGLIKLFHKQAIWCSSILLFLGFFMMFIDYEKSKI